jgi:hypothetical protein
MTHMPLHIASTGMRWLDHIHGTKNTVKLSDRTDHSPLQDIVRITTVSCENGGGEFILCSTYPPPRAVPCSPMDNGYDEHSNYVGLFFAYNFMRVLHRSATTACFFSVRARCFSIPAQAKKISVTLELPPCNYDRLLHIVPSDTPEAALTSSPEPPNVPL